MKSIQSWEQLADLEEPYKTYLTETKKRIPNSDAWNFTEWGYWIIIERFEELYLPLKINSIYTLLSIREGLLKKIELIEEHFGVCEIVVLLDNDFGVGILFRTDKISDLFRKIIETHKLSCSK